MNPGPGDIVNAAGVVKSNWFFDEYHCPPGVSVQLTPSNDVNQVIQDGKVIAVFHRNDAFGIQQFLRGLSNE